MKRFPLIVVLAAVAGLSACDRRAAAPTAPLARAIGASSSNSVVTNAVYTIVNDSADGPGTCANGGDTPQNCNIYAEKEHVWLGGESVNGKSGLADGMYFFAVLQPGGQWSPNDGSDKVLSDVSPSTATGAGDPYTNRIFSLSAGVIAYDGSHAFGSNKIRLFPYDDTPNPGGVYIMAVCSLANGYPVTPSDCKYDAFTVKTAGIALPLTATKTAAGSSERQFAWSITKGVDRTIVRTGSGTFNYGVTVSRDTGTVRNIRVAGTITISNPNDATVAITGITDRLSDGTVCSLIDAPTSLPKGDTVVNYSCTVSTLPTQPLSNSATVSWSAQNLGALSLEAGSAVATTDNIVFTGTAIDASVFVTDTYGDLGPATATQTFTYAKSFSNDALGTCATFGNTATFTTSDTRSTGSASQGVKVCAAAKPLTAAKTAAGANDRTYHWSIAKTVDQTVVKSSNGSATFTYTVTATRDAGTPSNIRVTGNITLHNPNDAAVAVTGITDMLSDGSACAIVNAPAVLPAGDTQLAYTCDLSGLPTQPLTNTVTASWSAQDLGDHSLEAGSATATVAAPFTETAIDGTVSVTDTFGDLGSAAESKTFTYSKTFSGNLAGTCTSYNNVAAFVTSETQATGSASQAVKVCVGANLTASKTTAPSFTRTYAWGISKAVDKSVVKQVGGSATFNYTVNAGQTGSTDSDWLVSGMITVNNPNDWEAISVNLASAIDNGGVCAIAGGNTVLVPASSSVSRDYSCSYAAAPAPLAYSTTTVAGWDAVESATPVSSATASASGAFGGPTTTVNSSVTVRDTFNGTISTLGTLYASDITPATGAWNYGRTLAVVANLCTTYNNTAAYNSINGATGSASQNVMVCGNVAGGLTKGFWQNKNGQAIISGGAATLNVCNSGGWLRQYAPFQDLSATATCAQVAAYAMNIINAANASGAAMNAMLKAQMLATAFDVYFSDATLGGNKILAPTALGGLKVDLSAVCSTISACAGKYSSTSNAFGGATSLTVSQLLAYAASQSNAGGSAWYGQVKSTQELAKNSFDAINNAVAFIAP